MLNETKTRPPPPWRVQVYKNANKYNNTDGRCFHIRRPSIYFNIKMKKTDKKQIPAEGVKVIAPDDVAQMAIERTLRSALPRCEQATAILRDFGIRPSTRILHECVTMSERWEQKEDKTPSFKGFDEKAKWTHTMTTKAVFHDCPTLDAKLAAMLTDRTKSMTPKEVKEFAAKFDAEVTTLKEALIKCFKSNTNGEDIKHVVLRYVETDVRGNVKAADDAKERIEFDTAIKVDTPESVASYEAHVKAAEALNAFIDTLINANRLDVVADIQQLFTVNTDTLTLSPVVINYKLFSEK